MAEVMQPLTTETTQDERTIALLAHMLQIMLWWTAPLAIFLVKRKSKFISFHALQVLLLQVAYLLLTVAGMFLGFGFFFLTAAAGSVGHNADPPPGLLILMPMLWLSFMGMGIIVLVGGIVYGVRAGRGEWAEYPFFGALSRSILKIGPGGTPA